MVNIEENNRKEPTIDEDVNESPIATASATEEFDDVDSPTDSSWQTRAFSFAHLLVESGVLTEEQVKQALETSHRERLPLSVILERDGLVLSRDLAAIVALHTGLTMVDLRSQVLDPEAVSVLSEDLARKYLALAIRKDDQRLTVAMTDPTDLQTIQDLTVRSGYIIDPVIATPKDITEHIDLAYRIKDVVTDTKETGQVGGRVTAKRLRDAQPAEVIDLLLRQALQDRASDIHIEPADQRLRIRFRIDGILHDVMNLPLEMHPTFISRLKVMANLNIAERRRPQDGQFTVEVQNRKVDVRVAVSSTVGGEMSVLRLLDKQFTLLGLDQLGMSPAVLERYRRLLKLPYGMIIICGPTGAGKSSSLYASILQIDRKEQNVITLEDPVEYRIAETNQMQVHPEAGITFATQLRSILRLDPDIILLGEIRDQETAVIATQAALTGHLVLTSLHANDSVAALLRLRDLGVAPYLITSSLAGIVAQRMVRLVCRDCRMAQPTTPEEENIYSEEMNEPLERVVSGTGCNFCAQTGYRGRTGVFETMIMSDSLRRMFLADALRFDMYDQAIKEGMIPLRRDAMLKVKDGITTPHEVMRVLFTLE